MLLERMFLIAAVFDLLILRDSVLQRPSQMPQFVCMMVLIAFGSWREVFVSAWSVILRFASRGVAKTFPAVCFAAWTVAQSL